MTARDDYQRLHHVEVRTETDDLDLDNEARRALNEIDRLRYLVSVLGSLLMTEAEVCFEIADAGGTVWEMVEHWHRWNNCMPRAAVIRDDVERWFPTTTDDSAERIPGAG